MKHVMAKVSKVSITVILSSISIILIALSVRTCLTGGDDSNVEPQETKVNIDTILQNRIDSFVQTVPYVGRLGLMVYDATAREEVYSLNADSLMSPASCMKLLTCVTAIKKFGLSAQHKTRLYISGTTKGDTLRGNITLKTQFDPFFTRDSLYLLTELLPVQGIRKLEGRVVIDMADYDLLSHEAHWTPGDLRTRYLGLPFAGSSRMRKEVIYALARVGISVKPDDVVFGRLDYANSTQVGIITSPMQFSFLKALKNSSNINAEALLYPLGYTKSTKGHFRMNGLHVLRDFVKNELRMDPATSCVIEDGCGLCPHAKLTPRLLCNLLDYAYRNKFIYKELLADLPLSGTDGTLYDRLYKPSVKGRVHAKTGTLTRDGGICTLSGYFTTKAGHLIIFSILNNECPVMDGRWWQDKFLTRIID